MQAIICPIPEIIPIKGSLSFNFLERAHIEITNPGIH